MSRYLILTEDEWGYQYTTKQECWQNALSKFYEYIGGGKLSIEDFKLLIKNKVAKEAVGLFNKMVYDSDNEITFFGRIEEPFVNDFKEIEECD